jgi:hypothetical protein
MAQTRLRRREPISFAAECASEVRTRFYPGLEDRVVASNLEVLGRGFTAIGNFLEFNRLTLVER